MWSPRLVVPAVVLLLLSGCGLRPLYGTHQGHDMSDTLAQIEVGPIKDRAGQQLRNSLLDALTPRGPSGAGQRYFLNVDLTESISNLAVQKDAFTTRANLELTASFSLVDRAAKETVVGSTSLATASFNILGSEFATLMAERSARARAIRSLSEEIRTQLATSLRERTEADSGGK